MGRTTSGKGRQIKGLEDKAPVGAIQSVRQWVNPATRVVY
jgi:hypothetical protein